MPPYKIHTSLLQAPWFEKLVANTLDMYSRGEDLSNSPLTRTGRKLARRNKWHWTLFNVESETDLESGLRKRETALIELYHSMKEYGYNGSIIAAWFDADGQVHLYDGFHRLAVMRYLGIETQVNVETIWWCKDYDFPLRDTLEELPRAGKCTYQPVADPRVADFSVDRQDSTGRLEYIKKNLVFGGSVLDIGCSEGFFSMELAKLGYQVTACDTDRGKVAVTRYLSTINNINLECYWGAGEELVKLRGKKYDNILYLSVFHNNITNYGLSKAFVLLRHLRGKAKKLFFEVPDGPREWQWKDASAGKPLFHFKGKDFEGMIEEILGMKVVELSSGFRPLYLLAEDKKLLQQPIFRPISDEEWQKHNRWEKNWWGNCTNSYGEQVLQQMYASSMRLDQFAGPKYSFKLGGRSVLDIGGGPVSLLLRCEDFSRGVVVDPCKYPGWVKERYKAAGIEFVQMPAEDIQYSKEFDEVWIYNVLQHVRDPKKVVKNAMAAGKKIRVHEVLEVGTHDGHPHNLSKEALDEAFGKEGVVFEHGGKPGDIYYVGVFNYG